MAERQQKTTEEGGLHRFRTEIPHTVVRGSKSRGISVHAKWLYVYFKSVCGDGRECWRTTTTIATESGLSRAMVSTAKKELVAQGLIVIRRSKNPNRQADHVWIKDIWDDNWREFSVLLANANHSTPDKANSQEDKGSVLLANAEPVVDNSGVLLANAEDTDIDKENSREEEVSVLLVNAEDEERSISERSVLLANTGVLLANQRRSQEEDPKKKEDQPPTPLEKGESKRSRTKASQVPNTDYTPGFNKAWALYPRKEKKVDTFTIWRERNLEARAGEIAEKIARLQVTLWKGKEMQYIPLPTTWFNEARYEDDLIPLANGNERPRTNKAYLGE